MDFRFLILLGLVASAESYRHFENELPSGDMVPHPCKPNHIWRGVGHENPLGGGERNVFGLAFASQGFKWTKTLCEADSDGDGLTNGQELGDPQCVWSPGQFPSRTKAITHPGVCDPWGSDKCKDKNKDVSCTTDKFICPAIHEPHVRNMTITIPRTNVPTRATTYMCMTFDLEFPSEDPPDQLYHMIATQPTIDNLNVMHHMILYGCDDTAKVSYTQDECYMAQGACYRFMGLWTLGVSGECLYKDAGFLFGGSATRRVLIQYHWNNPERRADYYDASGMTLFYTKQLRKYNAGLLITGQINLHIPPHLPRVVKQSTCTSECTQSIMKGNVYVTGGVNHMHYLGYKQNVELFRGGKKVLDLVRDDVYSYDNPIMHTYDKPVVIHPGDEMKTTCVYRSLSKSRTTFYGAGTYDEMCYSIMNIFPVENITNPVCISWGSIDRCGGNTIEAVRTCDEETFRNKSHPATMEMRTLIMENCNFYGSCRPECRAAVAKVRKNPCLQGEVGDYMMWELTWSHEAEDSRFLSALTSCDGRVTGNDNTDFQKTSSGTTIVASVVVLLSMMATCL